MPKDLGEFAKLVEEKPTASKTSNADLKTFLSEAMHTTKEVAAYLSVENGTAFSRLRRLEKNGIITRRWEGNKAFWVARTAVGMQEAPPEVEEGEDKDEEEA